MTQFFTIIAFKDGVSTADTQASRNAHNSVRSYKTENAARQAISRGARVVGVTYRILRTQIWPNGHASSRWLAGDW